MSWQPQVFEFLVASLVRPFVLVAAAWIVFRVFRVSHSASKHAVWTVVLAGMLLLPFASVTAPHVNVAALPEGFLEPIRIVKSSAADDVSLDRRSVSGLIPDEAKLDGGTSTTASGFSPSTSSTSRRIRLESVLLWGYLTGVAAFGAYRLAGWIMLRRLLSRARPLRRKPLFESGDVTIPIAVGIWRPAVVLPANWRRWQAATRRSILAHELSHVRRKDAWVLALSRWATCVFWFHPLVWWVSRRTAELAEMACDAASLETTGDPAGYARILLDFSRLVNRRGYRAALPGLAMVGPSPLSRRIDQLFAASAGQLRRLRRPGTVFTLVGIPTLCAATVLGLTEAVSRPLVEAKKLIAQEIQLAAPVGLEQPLAALAFLFPEEAQPSIAPPQQPAFNAFNAREFIDRNCVTCHSRQGRNGGINLETPDLTAIQANAKMWEKALTKVRGGFKALAPPGVPRPDSTAVRGFGDWLETELDRNAPVALRTAVPHRLNRTEYGNAVGDLLGVQINPALLFESDDTVQGFDNLVEAQQSQPVRPELYKTAAEGIIRLALDSPNRSKIFICRPTSAADEAQCGQKVISSLAARAYRSLETPEDIARLTTVFTSTPSYYAGWSASTFDRRVASVLQAVLTDRKFLYRTEQEPAGVAPGQGYRISDLELASRLSFFLWSTGPDDQLLDLARRGQLRDPATLERETQRLLKDPRAEALTLNFAGQWLRLRGLQRQEPQAYPDFDESLRQAMRRETELFFSSIVQGDRNVLDLMTADYTFLNERLARHYGIPNVNGSEFRRVTLGAAFDVRRGLLGKASFLTVTSRESRTSPIERGNTILEKFLNSPPPDPPPNVAPMPAVLNLPMRRVMDQQDSVNPACGSCHQIFLPVGLALDNFDLAGKWRTQENGATIDPVTELNDGTKLAGPADVRNAIVARSDLFVQTLTQRLLTYGLGRRTNEQDMPLVRAIARDAARDGNRFSAIIVGIVKSAPFQMNVKG